MSSVREHWYAYYRLLRIARREALQAAIDCTLYGTGVVHVQANGEAKHIPWKGVFRTEYGRSA